jgi:hypothetical protein
VQTADELRDEKVEKVKNRTKTKERTKAFEETRL